jgi:adenylate cyclase
MADRMSEDELAERSGMAPERIRRLAELRILEPEDGMYPRRDVLRARVIADLEAMGVEPEGIAKALASGHLSLGYLESTGRRPPRSDKTFTELADDIGVPFPTLEKMYVSMGLPRPRHDERVREEDLLILKAVPVLFSAGVGEGAVLQALRVWGDSARRVAQYQSHYLHASIEEPFRRRGLGDNEAFEAAIRDVGVKMGHSGEQMLGWLFRRHSETFMTEHDFQHAETALEQAGVYRRTPHEIEACVFADLSGYTSLTEEAGDEAAARASLTLAQLVSEVAARHGGEVVKMLGDGVHFHFRGPTDAVRASLEIVDTVVPSGLPPAHVGVEAGPMIYDEGDYFGRTVNLAARIASQAGPHQVFVGEGAAEVVTQDGFQLVEVGPVELKGISRPVTLSEVVRESGGNRA